MNCPYCKELILLDFPDNDSTRVCRNRQHFFSYNVDSKYFRLIVKDVEVGQDLIGHYIYFVTPDNIHAIYPFEIEDAYNIMNRFLKVKAFL
jgi:hypothetical protein